MANKLFAIVLLIALLACTGWIGMHSVEGAQCTEGLGACGTDCQARCSAKHPTARAQGSCDTSTGLPLCTCYYNCEPPSAPARPKTCSGGAGLCSARCNAQCCNANCAAKYDRGVGFCNTLGTSLLCQCQYPC